MFQSHLWERVERGVLTDMARRAREEVGDMPLFYTEWGSLAGLPSDGAFGASFIVKTILDNQGLVDGYSFWAFTDIFEESPQRAEAFHGGFGLMTQHGIPKAPYRAFQLLRSLSGQQYETVVRERTVDVYAFRDEERRAVRLLAVNHQSLLHPIAEETVRMELSGAGCCQEAVCVRIDDKNANALTTWQAMGSPAYLTEAQRLALEAASCLEERSHPFRQEGDRITLDVAVPPMGIALVTLYL